MGKHSILLVQFTHPGTRRYDDYQSVDDMMDGICKLFEQKLRQGNPQASNFSYDIQNLYEYIDGLSDLGCLVFDKKIGAYVPYNKSWIKQQVFSHLKSMANRR